MARLLALTAAALLAILALQPPLVAGVSIEDLIDVLDHGRTLAVSVFRSWDVLREITDQDDDEVVPFPLLRSKEKRVLARVAELSRQIAQLDARMSTHSAGAVGALLRELPARLRLEMRLDRLADMMTRIGVGSAQMERYASAHDNDTSSAQKWTLERHTLEDFAAGVVSHGADAVPGLLERVHLSIAPVDGGRGVLMQLANALQDSGGSLCSMQQSPQQLVYNVYSTAALTELKGYAMMQFSWMLLRLYGKGNFTVEAKLMRERYQERTLQKIDAVKAAMAAAKADLYRCDPRHHVEGETYVQLTRLLQGHLQNEVDMNGENTCRENCGYYSYAKSHGCYHNLYCKEQQRCSGKLIDCKYYDSDMWVCQGDGKSGRRYDWIEYENGRILGTKGTCRSTKVDSWWRWLFWHCSYCFCLCDEQGPKSDRYFNLRAVTSDTANNMVITGLRLVKHNRIIHFQVQESPLLPRGGVNASATRWRPVDDYHITDDDVVDGHDYHTLSWEQRAFDLDDLVAPPGHVLTGIRWRRVGTHLNPEIAVTALDFANGALVEPEHSQWIGNDNTDASLDRPRTQLHLSHPDVPTKSHAASTPDSAPDQFVLFTHTDVDADAAQTTVPFLCSQPVAPEPVTLLSGAGLMHRGRAGYGGFVAPKVVTYDFAQHIHAVYPAEPTYRLRAN